MSALATDYMGLRLANPLVASPSPHSYTYEGMQRLEAAGVGAIVMYSLFEEQVREQQAQIAELVDGPAESFAEALDYVPDIAKEDVGTHAYLNLLERAAGSLRIPVIASLNGTTSEGWTIFARDMQEAGAAGIELNIAYLPGDPATSGREVEQRHVEALQSVKEAVGIPVAVKLGPYFSAAGEIALALDRAGADALVLFNRFLYPDVDPEELVIVPRVGLSTQAEGRLPRAWIALLRGRVSASLAGTGGVDDAADVARYLLAGADVVMTTSALLRRGERYTTELLAELTAWMERKGFAGVDDFRGMLAVPADTDAADFERAGYVAAMRAANAGAYTP